MKTKLPPGSKTDSWSQGRLWLTMKATFRLSIVFVLAAALSSMIGCREEVVPEVYAPTDDHAGYRASLKHIDLDETALGKDWITAAHTSVTDPMPIELPYRESVYFSAAEAQALGLRISVEQGRRLDVDAKRGISEDFRVFIDLFRVDEQQNVHVASGSTHDDRLTVDVKRKGAYVLRIQPELLRGGTILLTVESKPSLAFPVRGHDMQDAISHFGDPRDGGTRMHEGIDILAPRGTEVLAPAIAHVRHVGTSVRGGNVVWMVDEGGTAYYFAHLDTQSARSGTVVAVGDVIGTVGNTGNALTTVPHLHFGVYEITGYRRGAVDPYYYLYDAGRQPADVVADTGKLGRCVRTATERVPFIASRPPAGQTNRELPPDTLVLIIGAFQNSYRVRLPDGVVGSIDTRAIAALDDPLDTRILNEPKAVLDRPHPQASVIRVATSGTQLEVLGRFDRYRYVEIEENAVGWIWDL